MKKFFRKIFNLILYIISIILSIYGFYLLFYVVFQMQWESKSIKSDFIGTLGGICIILGIVIFLITIKKSIESKYD